MKKGTAPLLDRGTVLASLAVAIALGATSLSDIALLAHLAPVLGDATSGPTVRRALDLAGAPAVLGRVARARAKAREHAWKLIEAAPARFPCLAIAARPWPTGWSSTWTPPSSPHTPTKREPPRPGRKATVSTHWRPDAWAPGLTQDGDAEDDKDVAEISGLMTRAGNWPGGLRWIARRVKPSRRHMWNLTGYEKKTGWKYSITCTNVPDDGIPDVPGSHPQYIDVVHREHAVVETAGVRTAKAMGLRNLPSKTWQVKAGWVLAANIAADLSAWTRLPGHHDAGELRDTDPETLRYRIWHLPARLARHARQRTLAISPDWPWTEAFLTCWQRLCALPAPA